MITRWDFAASAAAFLLGPRPRSLSLVHSGTARLWRDASVGGYGGSFPRTPGVPEGGFERSRSGSCEEKLPRGAGSVSGARLRACDGAAVAWTSKRPGRTASSRGPGQEWRETAAVPSRGADRSAWRGSGVTGGRGAPDARLRVVAPLTQPLRRRPRHGAPVARNVGDVGVLDVATDDPPVATVGHKPHGGRRAPRGALFGGLG